ncbi:DNA-binding response regulator [Methylobacterium currus]|uniref:DNA-binding response regulator n=1 Tax=Methylobacterium currus TaxID=2051553 RepID=A0A2R4WIR2_9HYPH|nr:response regulator transcription factor [Methylobacterium currus]AWB21415.1 DNA-binding response regulator [Methylobacterium currus]UHC13829.1 response regulator transcription factor [Methylobacterium currus]
MTRVVVVDDHPIVLQGARRLLEDAGAEVRGAACLPEAYRAILRHRPDVAVIDLAFPGRDVPDRELAGLALIGRVRKRAPATRVLVFSMHADPAIVARALAAGAVGYVLKDAPAGDLVRAYEQVRTGRPYLDGRLATEVALLQADPRRSLLGTLSPRERRILALLAEGWGYTAIAADLSVSYKTVTNSCAALRQRLGLATLTELTHFAVRHVADLR